MYINAKNHNSSRNQDLLDGQTDGQTDLLMWYNWRRIYIYTITLREDLVTYPCVVEGVTLTTMIVAGVRSLEVTERQTYLELYYSKEV